MLPSTDGTLQLVFAGSSAPRTRQSPRAAPVSACSVCHAGNTLFSPPALFSSMCTEWPEHAAALLHRDTAAGRVAASQAWAMSLHVPPHPATECLTFVGLQLQGCSLLSPLRWRPRPVQQGSHHHVATLAAQQQIGGAVHDGDGCDLIPAGHTLQEGAICHAEQLDVPSLQSSMGCVSA